jgi:solute carrier family 6 (neurotransmitter transporter), invertebrate
LQGITVLLFFSSESSRLYDWNIAKQNHYWEVWARELGSCLQLMPILLVPLVAIVQTCRYLSKGPSDLFEVGFGEIITITFLV